MIRKPKIAIGGIIIKNNKILLIKRRDDPDRIQWAIPGGKVEINETLEEALKREMKEETGLNVSRGSLMAVTEFINTNFHYIILDYECDIISGNMHANSDALETKYFDIDHIDGEKINETTMELLKKIRNNVLPISICHENI